MLGRAGLLEFDVVTAKILWSIGTSSVSTFSMLIMIGALIFAALSVVRQTIAEKQRYPFS